MHPKKALAPTQGRKIKLMMAGLCAAYLIQSWLVYTDSVGSTQVPLSASAEEGRKLWRRESCQTCHQIYGYGGFLGPDLTNAAPRLSPEILQAFFKAGPKQMPTFAFSEPEVRNIYAFLSEVNRTGTSQARARSPSAEWTAIARELPWFEFK